MRNIFVKKIRILFFDRAMEPKRFSFCQPPPIEEGPVFPSLSGSYIGVLHREQNSNLQVASSSLVALDCVRGLTLCFEPYIYGYLTQLVFIHVLINNNDYPILYKITRNVL